MPKLKTIPASEIKALIGRVEDVTMELHELSRFTEGGYVEDLSEEEALQAVSRMVTLSGAASKLASYYSVKLYLYSQERELKKIYKQREAETKKHNRVRI